ncbi:MAG: 50S ribosomal protein L32 [Candidatus Omnitrophica bacterium]|jgi:large subunit ribosomal protein L32|nr:50S ribosomal protein L32 [Candidatus Omnitrophota bacterium]
MPNPKRRHSNTRTRKRRTHDKITSNASSKCPQCGADREPHRICVKCGTYRGKQVLSVKSA